MLGALDRWIGRVVFVPPIVRFCQWSGWTQFGVHNYLYLIGSYMLLMASLNKDPSGAGLAFVLAVVITWKVGRDPEYPGYESRFLRYLFIVLFPIHATSHIVGEPFLIAGPDWGLSCPVSLMWLAAEYARTIKTIPPLEEKKEAVRRVVGEVV